MRLDNAAKEEIPIQEANDRGLISFFSRVEKQRIRARDERMSYTRVLRETARQDAILDLFKDAILAFEPDECMTCAEPADVNIHGNAIYAM